MFLCLSVKVASITSSGLRSTPKPCRSGLSEQTDEGQGPSVTSPTSAASSALGRRQPDETSELLKKQGALQGICMISTPAVVKRFLAKACFFGRHAVVSLKALQGLRLTSCGRGAKEIAPWPRPRLVELPSQIPQFAKVWEKPPFHGALSCKPVASKASWMVSTSDLSHATRLPYILAIPRCPTTTRMQNERVYLLCCPTSH